MNRISSDDLITCFHCVVLLETRTRGLNHVLLYHSRFQVHLLKLAHRATTGTRGFVSLPSEEQHAAANCVSWKINWAPPPVPAVILLSAFFIKLQGGLISLERGGLSSMAAIKEAVTRP